MSNIISFSLDYCSNRSNSASLLRKVRTNTSKQINTLFKSTIEDETNFQYNQQDYQESIQELLCLDLNHQDPAMQTFKKQKDFQSQLFDDPNLRSKNNFQLYHSLLGRNVIIQRTIQKYLQAARQRGKSKLKKVIRNMRTRSTQLIQSQSNPNIIPQITELQPLRKMERINSFEAAEKLASVNSPRIMKPKKQILLSKISPTQTVKQQPTLRYAITKQPQSYIRQNYVKETYSKKLLKSNIIHLELQNQEDLKQILQTSAINSPQYSSTPQKTPTRTSTRPWAIRKNNPFQTNTTIGLPSNLYIGNNTSSQNLITKPAHSPLLFQLQTDPNQILNRPYSTQTQPMHPLKSYHQSQYTSNQDHYRQIHKMQLSQKLDLNFYFKLIGKLHKSNVASLS